VGESEEDLDPVIGRVLRTGLSSLRDRAANLHRRLAAAHINPSRIEFLRFTVGRALIHAGLRVMPHGRVRSELTNLLADWSEQVRAKVLAYNFADGDGLEQ
jgi:hypothetical protein